MSLKLRELNRAITAALAFGSVAALAAAPAFAQDEDENGDTAQMETVEVTGSRIKRTDAEGSVPVTVIDRQQLELSGEVSVADYLRNTTFNSFGSFRPQSGSSAQSFAELNLRGLGGARTLILVDGRRAPIAPQAGQGQDLNSIPLAAVERIEILTDGASAIYGSDAIGGVVNIITRSDFSGVEMSFGMSNPKREGGETEQGSVIFGAAGDRGNIIAGASYDNRGIIFNRDRPWSRVGVSTFSNNTVAALPLVPNPNPNNATNWRPGPAAAQRAVPGGCSDRGFSIGTGAQGQAICLYNFALVAADEAEIRNSSLFTRANYEINEDWSTYMNASVARVESFGRYAPVPAVVFIPPNTPNNRTNVPVFLRHRFDSLGNRDTFVDSQVYEFLVGFEGRIGNFDVDFGARRNEFKFTELGRNYLVIPIAEQFIARGDYNIFNPRGNPANVLNSMKVTINREAAFEIEELYATANVDLFEMNGGVAGLAFGAEYRDEYYQDLYDSLSEGGVVGGSAGNSAAGGRSVGAAYAEALFPVTENFEINGAVRYDRYSDYGSDVSPKLSMRFTPFENLVLRASYGEGFRAPTLDILTQLESFSASAVSDPATCRALGQPPTCNVQIDAFRIANPELESEQSRQWSIGAAWDATDWLNASLDIFNVEIDNRIAFFSANTLVIREQTGRPVPPGLGVFRFPDGSIDFVREGNANEGDLELRGADLNVRTNFDFGDIGNLRNQLQISMIDNYTIDGGENLVGDNSQPKYRSSLNNEYVWGDFSFVWNLNYIHTHNDSSEGGKLPSWTTHDLQASWNAPWNGRFTVGVNNVADKDPVLDPFGGCSSDGSPRGYCTQLYDGYGRVPYFRYTQSF